jgi:hypothetical protein
MQPSEQVVHLQPEAVLVVLLVVVPYPQLVLPLVPLHPRLLVVPYPLAAFPLPVPLALVLLRRRPDR